MISFIEQFGLLFLVIVGVSFLVKLMRQPIIVGYVISGFLFATLLQGEGMESSMHIFSEVGITFLLFLMGLEFDFKSIRFLGKDIIITTLLQSAVFFAFGYIVPRMFGFDTIHSIYIALLFMFSSTLLAAKWLEDKKESRTLHGKIVLGTLILQDLLAFVALTVISLLKADSAIGFALVPVKGLILFGIAFIVSRYLLNKPLKIASRYPELLFIFSLSICFLFVIIAPLLGYSTTIGAFIGGVVLANTVYKLDISGRLRPLVIFFNMLFFVGLGFQIDMAAGPSILALAAVLVLGSLFLKPAIIFLTLRMRGYDSKTSLTSGLYLSQISEFGIIIIASGLAMGMVSIEAETIGVIALLASLLFSSYLIKYSGSITHLLMPLLRRLDRFFGNRYVSEMPDSGYSIIFFGYHDLSNDILEKLRKSGKKAIVIEHDPEKIEILKKEGYSYIYNTVNNNEFFENISFGQVELVISSLTDLNENRMILEALKRKNPSARAIMSAKSLKDSLALYDMNADYVLFTSYLNNQQVSVLLEDYTSDVGRILSKKVLDQAKFREIEKKRSEAQKNFDISLDLRKVYRHGMHSLRKRMHPRR